MTSVYLYVPNLIGYARLLLILISWLVWDSHPVLFVWLYSIGAVLDGVDGAAARRLNQTSAFGAWLDVVVDNIGRSMLWCGLFSWGWAVAVLEWCTFSCTHNQGTNWKESFSKAPFWVQAVMANGFKTPAGVLTIAGLHVFPIVHYGMGRSMLAWLNPLLIPARIILAIGRLLCAATECWCIVEHIRNLDRPQQEQSSKNN